MEKLEQNLNFKTGKRKKNNNNNFSKQGGKFSNETKDREGQIPPATFEFTVVKSNI